MDNVEIPAGRAHCGANLRQEREEGDDREPICRKPAGWGTDHVGVGKCRLHGGSTRAHVAHAEVETARIQVTLWGGRRDVHPAQALLELVQWKAAEVDYWRGRVAELEAEDLEWGTTRVKTGGDDRGTTEEAKPHIAHVMLRQAEQDLAAYAAAALKAGVDAALVQVVRSQADALGRVLRLLLEDVRVTVEGDPSLVVLDALRALGTAA